MSFINEKIPESDRELYDSFNLSSPFTNKPVESRKWTIDRERNAFLIALGGRGYWDSDIPHYYAFIWKNNVIKIETFSKEHGNANTGIEVRRKITSIKMPEKLMPEKDVVMELVKEAFEVHGFLWRKSNKVNFDYIASPLFILDA